MTCSTGLSSPAPEALPAAPRTPSPVQLEPLPRLEWSLAIETRPLPPDADSPARLRDSWVHQAPEDQVLQLFRELDGAGAQLPAPWWLLPVLHGRLPHRTAAFELEDEIHALLTERDGWFFVPWVGAGETGLWEYAPSERPGAVMPTTISMTGDHLGWVQAVPPHSRVSPPPVPVDHAAGLLAALEKIESW